MTATAVEGDSRDLAPFPSAPIEDMLRLLVKGVRAQQLYLQNNPTYVRAIEQLRAAFPPIWEHAETFSLKVTESTFEWEGIPVLHEHGTEAADNLAWVFYKDGVRELRFERGFEVDDLVPFLEIIQRARRHGTDDDDLLVMLWERDIHHLRYRYVDVAMDDAAPAGEFPTHFEARVVEPPDPNDLESAEKVIEPPRPGVVNLDDYESTLHFLDEGELVDLRAQVQRAYSTDLQREVVTILLDIFETESTASVRQEVAQLLDGMMLYFLSAGQLQPVAYLVRETQVALARAPALTDEQREQLTRVPDRLSEPDVLSQVLQSLDESPELPTQEDLTALFAELRPTALATIFSWSVRVQDPRLRTLLQTAAERLAVANTAELARLVDHADPEVALEAMRRAASLKAAATVMPIAKRLAGADLSMRLAAAQALAEIGSPGALQALDRALEDTERDVRITAARALALHAFRAALPRVEGLVTGPAMRRAERAERVAMFDLFGTICGDRGVPFLDRVLNGRGLLRRHANAEMRVCAATALGRIGTAGAGAALERAEGSKDVVVRAAVTKALRGARAVAAA